MSIDSCVLYARLSVSKDESVSIERQLESGRKYAEARGWTVLGEYVDDGVSATANRPEDRRGWTALLATRGFDAVVIWKVDRLARRVLDFLHVDEVLRARGAGLVAVEDPIDMTTAQGRAFATMLAVFGEMEAEAMRARVRAARAQLLKDGRWPGGGVPYGYATAANPHGAGRVLVKDPDRFEWLEQIVAMARRGEPINAIARWLDRADAPLPGKKTASGWSRQTVDGILHNPVLAGMTPYNPGRGRAGKAVDPMMVVRDSDGNPVVNTRLALLTVDEFQDMVRTVDNRGIPQARKAGQRQSTSPLLSRVAVCDQCGVYLCRGTNQGKPVLTCPKCRQTIGRTMLDPWIIKKLLRQRGTHPFRDTTVRVGWDVATALGDVHAQRDVLVSQLASLTIRRGVVGRYFDPNRILLTWKPEEEDTNECA